MEPAVQELSMFFRLYDSCSQWLRLCNEKSNHNGIRKRLEKPWKLCTLKLGYDALLAVLVLRIQHNICQWAVNVLQVQVGYILQRVDDATSPFYTSVATSFFVLNRTYSFCKTIGMMSGSRAMFLPWTYLKLVSRPIEHEVKREHPEGQSNSGDMCHSDPCTCYLQQGYSINLSVTYVRAKFNFLMAVLVITSNIPCKR